MCRRAIVINAKRMVSSLIKLVTCRSYVQALAEAEQVTIKNKRMRYAASAWHEDALGQRHMLQRPFEFAAQVGGMQCSWHSSNVACRSHNVCCKCVLAGLKYCA